MCFVWTQCPKIVCQSEAMHSMRIDGNVIYYTYATYCIIDTMEAINAVLLCMMMQFLSVEILMNVYIYK